MPGQLKPALQLVMTTPTVYAAPVPCCYCTMLLQCHAATVLA